MKRVDNAVECRAELLLRARRSAITDSEALALSAHLASCESCQLLSDLGRDFEAIGGADAGDSAVLSRISERTLHSVRLPVSRLPKARVFWLAAASVALMAGLAGATLLSRSVARTPAPHAALATSPLPTAVSSALSQSAALSAAGAETGSTAPEATLLAPDLAPATPGSASPSRVLGRPLESASKLFREANEARRAGDSTLATSLYRELQRRFPDAPETKLSRISLGSMLLGAGTAQAALQQFDAYLAVPRGALAAEAIYGRARALKSLHRAGDEAAAWHSLLEQFPRSPYASYAKRRLDEMH